MRHDDDNDGGNGNGHGGDASVGIIAVSTSTLLSILRRYYGYEGVNNSARPVVNTIPLSRWFGCMD